MEAEEFNYKEYFDSIKPKKKMDIYNRFIFSFCSVHTTWQYNIKGYELLKNKYHNNIDTTKALIKKAGIGLTNHRTDYILEFTKKFLIKPKFYMKANNETWKGYAVRLQNDIKGLGFAKTRFAIELIYPNTAKLVCVDTHIIQLHKQNPNKMNKKLYEKIENGFLNHASNNKTNPIEMRWKFWDKKQGYNNPRYWSRCLEPNPIELDKVYNSINM